MTEDLTSSQRSRLEWTAKEVVVTVDERPHLVVRVDITGGFFPHRSAEPVVRIVSDEEVVLNWFSEVAGDNRRLSGYFAVNLLREGRVEYGYGGQQPRVVPGEFRSKEVERLDRERLPADFIEVDSTFLRDRRNPG